MDNFNQTFESECLDFQFSPYRPQFGSPYDDEKIPTIRSFGFFYQLTSHSLALQFRYCNLYLITVTGRLGNYASHGRTEKSRKNRIPNKFSVRSTVCLIPLCWWMVNRATYPLKSFGKIRVVLWKQASPQVTSCGRCGGAVTPVWGVIARRKREGVYRSQLMAVINIPHVKT